MALTEDPIGILSGTSAVRTISKTLIEMTDLLSEGEIDGLVSKEYKFVGTAGQTGWQTIETTELVPTLPAYGHLGSVYLNDIPVLSKEGLYNFQDVQFSKTNGAPNGEFSSANLLRTETKRTRGINERLRGPNYNAITKVRIGEVDQFAKYYKIFNKDCHSIEVNIKVSDLSHIDRFDQSNVKITDSSIELFVVYRPLFSDATSPGYSQGAFVRIKGRIASPYVESTRIDFSANLIANKLDAFLGWEVKIYRTTRDPLDSDTQSSSFLDSISEIYGSKFSYPNSAIASFNFDAEYFSQVPNRSYDARLLKVKIPSNYDPLRKVYSGHWDGQFQTGKAWTDNPAWCFYDLVTNSRYGLGKYIDDQYVDKWTLYEIGQYCDVLVQDGLGSIEPRFTANLMIQSREEAYKVINDMSSIFRGIAYYAAGSIYVNQDSEKKRPIYQFTNASVEDGEFLYSSSSSKLRRNVAVVRYNDKANSYKPAIEYVEDVDGIRKNGIKETEIAAFGCTSRGQASRLGRWMLFTENLETETVSFVAGLEANYLRPGDVISVSDQNRNVRRRGGRLSNFDASAKTLTLDSALSGINASKKYFISLLTPSYFYDTSVVELNNSNDVADIRRGHVQNFYLEAGKITVGESSTTVNLSPDFPDISNYALLTGAVWTLSVSGNEQGKAFPRIGSDFSDLEELSSKNETFRILSVEESETNKYKVSAMEYNPLKFTAIESGLSFDSSYSSVTPSAATSFTPVVLGFATSSQVISYTIISNDTDVSLAALSTYIVYAKSSPTNTDPWKYEDYQQSNPTLVGAANNSFSTNSLLPNPKYKIGIISAAGATSVTSDFAPFDNNVYYFFKVFASSASNATSSALSYPAMGAAGGVSITNNEPIKDIIIKDLRLDSDIGTTNAAGNKSSTLYAGASAPLNLKWTISSQAGSRFASNFQYKLTFRPTLAGNIPSKSANVPFFTITGYTPTNSVYPSYTFYLENNFSGNNKIPLRSYDVVVEAHDANGQSSAGGNVATSDSANYTTFISGYDILNVNNPKISNVILTDPAVGCQTSAAYCTEQFWTYDRDLKIIFNQIHTDISDAAGGFVYLSTGYFDSQAYVGQPISVANAAGIEVKEFTEFSSQVMVRPSGLSIYSSPYVYVAYSLYDGFDKEWRKIALAHGHTSPQLEKTTLISPTRIAVRPETRYFNGEGYKAWILIDLNKRGVGTLPYIKSFGIEKIQILDVFKTSDNSQLTSNEAIRLPDVHPYRSFKGIRRSLCKAVVINTSNNYYCGFDSKATLNSAKLGYTMDEMRNEFYMSAPVTSFDNLAKYTRIRCYFDLSKTSPPILRGADGVPIQDNDPIAYNSSYTSEFTRYKGDYHIIGDNINNAKYPSINDAKMKDISKLFYAAASNYETDGGLITDAFPDYSDVVGYNPHPAGFGQGFGGLEKNQKYFDVHMGRLVDGGVLSTALFGVVWTE